MSRLQQAPWFAHPRGSRLSSREDRRTPVGTGAFDRPAQRKMALPATYGRRRQAGGIIDGSDLVGSIRIPAGLLQRVRLDADGGDRVVDRIPAAPAPALSGMTGMSSDGPRGRLRTRPADRVTCDGRAPARLRPGAGARSALLGSGGCRQLRRRTCQLPAGPRRAGSRGWAAQAAAAAQRGRSMQWTRSAQPGRHSSTTIPFASSSGDREALRVLRATRHSASRPGDQALKPSMRTTAAWLAVRAQSWSYRPVMRWDRQA